MKRTWKQPKAVQIAGLKYKIKYVKSGCKYLAEREAGAIDQHDMTIYIDKSSAPQMQLLTLIHEICHGIAFVAYSEKSSGWREQFAVKVSELFLQALQSCDMLPILSSGTPPKNHGKHASKK